MYPLLSTAFLAAATALLALAASPEALAPLLAHDDYAVREWASAQLTARYTEPGGLAALDPVLRRLANSRSPEVAFRARRVWAEGGALRAQRAAAQADRDHIDYPCIDSLWYDVGKCRYASQLAPGECDAFCDAAYEHFRYSFRYNAPSPVVDDTRPHYGGLRAATRDLVLTLLVNGTDPNAVCMLTAVMQAKDGVFFRSGGWDNPAGPLVGEVMFPITGLLPNGPTATFTK